MNAIQINKLQNHFVIGYFGFKNGSIQLKPQYLSETNYSSKKMKCTERL